MPQILRPTRSLVIPGEGMRVMRGVAQNRAAAPSISYTGSPFTWYDYYTVVSLAVTNTGGPVTGYAVQAGTLPTGVSLNSSTGAITGTPTALKTAANVTIRATGPGGTSDAVLNIAVLWMPLGQGTVVVGYDTVAGFSGIWTDAARTTAAGDTDAAYTLDDLSGNADHAIQATAGARPTVETAGINSLRSLSFDGGDFMALAAFAGGSLAQANTLVTVGKLGVATGTQYLMDGETLNSQAILGHTTGNVFRIFAGTSLIGATAMDTALHLHTGVFNGASSAYYIDGTSTGSGNAGASAMDGVVLCANGSHLQPISAGSKFACWIVFDSDIGATARANLKTWAINKWGTPA